MNFADRVKDVITAVGANTFTLSGTPPAGGYQAIAAIGPTGTTFPYAASQGNLWESGVATITAANTVSRAPSASSSAGALVAFTVGADFICAPTAQAFNSIQSGAAIAVQSLTTTTGTITIPFSVGLLETAVALTLTRDVAITIGSAPAGYDQRMVLELIQDGTGGRVATFANPSWAGAVAPTLDTNPGRHNTLLFRAVGNDITGAAYSINRLPLVPDLPVAPASLAVTSANTQNTVTPSAVTAYPPVTGYNIYRGSTSGGESATPIATNVAIPYVDTGRTNGVTDYYKAAAVNSLGAGQQSPEASGTPGITAHYLNFTGATDNTNYAYFPDFAGAEPGAGDFRIEHDGAANTQSGDATLVAKWNDVSSTADQGWLFYRKSSGILTLVYQLSGGIVITLNSTVADGIAAGARVIRRVDFNASAGVVSFYLSTNNGTSFTQLGTSVTTASLGSVLDIPGDVLIGQQAGASANRPYPGKVYGFRLLKAGAPTLSAATDTTGMKDSISGSYLAKGSTVTVV